jgi:hemoglobin
VGPEDTPFSRIGEAKVALIVERFYDAMSEREPALAAAHRCDENGNVDRGTRDRFRLFLIGWLGGPDDYERRYGHPRLRMRHAHVAIDSAMRDAWLRCMAVGLDAADVTGDVRAFLDARFAEVADFLRNRPDVLRAEKPTNQ